VDSYLFPAAVLLVFGASSCGRVVDLLMGRWDGCVDSLGYE
jgi:hypothetical protein